MLRWVRRKRHRARLGRDQKVMEVQDLATERVGNDEKADGIATLHKRKGANAHRERKPGGFIEIERQLA